MTGDVGTAAARLADMTQRLLDDALPDHTARLVLGHDERNGATTVTVAPRGERTGFVALFAGGAPIAHLAMSMRLRWRAHLGTLEVEESRIDLFHSTDRQPLVRFEYRGGLTSAPPSHGHLHAERGAFTSLLARTADQGRGRRDPTRLSSLHIPLGGPHFRPSLADVVEFVITECGVDALPGWQRAIRDHRVTWRRDEAAATARQFPAETAAALRRLGWRVVPPAPRPVAAPFVLVAPEGAVSG